MDILFIPLLIATQPTVYVQCCIPSFFKLALSKH